MAEQIEVTGRPRPAPLHRCVLPSPSPSPLYRCVFRFARPGQDVVRRHLRRRRHRPDVGVSHTHAHNARKQGRVLTWLTFKRCTGAT